MTECGAHGRCVALARLDARCGQPNALPLLAAALVDELRLSLVNHPSTDQAAHNDACGND